MIKLDRTDKGAGVGVNVKLQRRSILRQAIYYANAWCEEYSGTRPYRVSDVDRLFQRIAEQERQLTYWRSRAVSLGASSEEVA